MKNSHLVEQQEPTTVYATSCECRSLPPLSKPHTLDTSMPEYSKSSGYLYADADRYYNKDNPTILVQGSPLQTFEGDKVSHFKIERDCLDCCDGRNIISYSDRQCTVCPLVSL